MGTYYEYLYLENLNKDIKFEEKLKAIEELGKMKSKLAKKKLIEIVGNLKNDEKLRIYSVLALIEIGDSKFIKQFLPLNKIEEKDILELLIIAISKLHAIEYIGEFLKFIDYSDKEIKLKIIECLSDFEEVESLKVLLKFYNKGDNEIKNLIKMNVEKSKVLKEYLEGLNEEEALNVITIIPKIKAEKLINKLIKTTNDKNILKILIKGIGELDLENGIELLKQLYYEVDDNILKLKIVEALENNKNKNKKEFLVELLKTENIDRNIKTKILFSIRELTKEEDVFVEVVKIIENKEEWWMLRKVAIMIIGEARNEKFLSVLIKVLEEEEDERVVRTLIQEIGEIGNEKSIPKLEKYLLSDNLDLKKVAVLALSKLGSKKVLGVLVQNKKIREELMPESLEAIINFDDPRVVEVLIEVLKGGKVKNIEKVLKGLALFSDEKIEKVLVGFINDKWNQREQRSKALMILASYKSDDVDEVLKTLLDDESEWWMLKKIAIVIIGEQKNYKLINCIARQTRNLDERISLNAKSVSKKFFKEYLLKNMEVGTEIYKFAENYLEIL